MHKLPSAHLSNACKLSSMRNLSGMVLVFSLLMLVVLSILMVSSLKGARMALMMSRNDEQAQYTRAVAERAWQQVSSKLASSPSFPSPFNKTCWYPFHRDNDFANADHRYWQHYLTCSIDLSIEGCHAQYIVEYWKENAMIMWQRISIRTQCLNSLDILQNWVRIVKAHDHKLRQYHSWRYLPS